MKVNEKGFFLFYDWFDSLKRLPAQDALDIIEAIAEYNRSGTDPTTKFNGALGVIVSMMFNQIKRAESVSAVRAENARATNEKKILRTQSERKTDFANDEPRKTDFANAEQRYYNNNNNYNNNNINNNNNSGAREREDEEQKSGSDEQIAEIKAYFKSKGFEKNAEDFIAYNSGRGWRGIGGECIFDRLTSYMDKWIAEERARARKPSKPTADKPRQGNFDVTDAFNKALERSYGNDE